jgi:tetracycline resistance efflux pump
MTLTWLSLVPPLVVIGAMLVTHQLNISLVIGIVSAALIVAQGNIVPALNLCVQKIIEHFSDIDIILLYILLVIISSLIVLLTVTGSAAGCARIISKKMKTARSGELGAIFLAFLLSIDDYLSILTVGLVMNPMADRLAIARTKLAYIIHALAGPLVIIVPISTWAAAIMAQLDAAGVNQGAASRIFADSFYVYLQTVPFIFYSLLTVLAVCFVVCSRIGFGAIGAAEQLMIAQSNQEDRVQQDDENKHSLIELLLPFGMLVGCVFSGIFVLGRSDSVFFILLIAAFLAFGSSVILLLHKKMVTIRQLPAIVYAGFNLMQSSIIMVILASILGSFLRLDLHTGSYLASVLLGKAPIFLLPVLFFIVSLIITLMTGSAWGAFSMLIPICTQMLIAFLQLNPPVALSQIPLLFPVLGAVLSGAACGNHISPFAETTFMTAACVDIDPLEHAKTQFTYAIPVLAGTVVSFILAGLMVDSGLLQSCLVSASAGIVVTMALLLWFACGKKQA